MKPEFEHYKPRKINFVKTVQVRDIYVKVYTISKLERYDSTETLQACINQLSVWTEDMRTSNLPTHRHAFLIVHEAREGVLILFNWWTGGEMLETKIYFSDYATPTKLEPSIFDNKALVCIWELQIFQHERKAWIAHVLMHPNQPDFEQYQKDIMLQQEDKISQSYFQ